MKNLIAALCFAVPSLSFVNAYALGNHEKEVLAQGLKAVAIAISPGKAPYGPHDRHDRDGRHDRDDRRGGGRSDGRAICISNGEFGGFEKFALYVQGRVIGGYTSKYTCERLLNSARAGLVCASNGEFGGFEKFAVADLRSGVIGGYTAMPTCERLVGSASTAYACVSDGQFGGFERFYLYDRRSRRTVGAGTYLQTCLNSIR